MDFYLDFIKTHAFELMDRSRCSRKDKIGVLPVCKQIMECCNKARREGLLALEDVLFSLDPQLAKATGMIINGWDPGLWHATLVVDLISGKKRGREIFKSWTILAGAFFIHNGVNPEIVQAHLEAIFGEDADLLDSGRETRDKNKSEPEWEEILPSITGQALSTGNGLVLNQLLAAIDDVAIQHLLRRFDEFQWCLALGVTGNQVAWNRVLVNLPRQGALRLLKALGQFDLSGDMEMVKATQDDMIAVIKSLKLSGESLSKINSILPLHDTESEADE